MKLTASNVRTETLAAGKSEAIVFDDDVPGFGLRLRAGGSRTFVFQYKLGAKHRRMALGAATALSVGKAREIAAQLHARVKLGEDPASDKADARMRAAETFKATADKYLAEQRTRLRPRTYPDLERHLLKHARTLHELQLAKIERRDIATVIAAVAKNSGLVTGNRVRTSLSSFYGWAMQRGLVETNPCIGTTRNKERPRERVLTPNELSTIWKALPENQFGAVVKLLMLTGQRAGEISALRWSEISDGMIVLSGERTKNHRPHIIPLSEPARAIIAAQQGRDGRDLVFGHMSPPGRFPAGRAARVSLIFALPRQPASRSRIGRRTICAGALRPMRRRSVFNRTSLRRFLITYRAIARASPASITAPLMRRRNAPRSTYGPNIFCHGWRAVKITSQRYAAAGDVRWHRNAASWLAPRNWFMTTTAALSETE